MPTTSSSDLWVPLGIDPRNTARYWAGDFMPVIGRRRPGASLPDMVLAFLGALAGVLVAGQG